MNSRNEMKSLYDNAYHLINRMHDRINLKILAKSIKEVIFKPVKHIMSTDVLTIGPNKTVYEASRKMVSEDCSCLIVQEAGNLKGIITESDFVNKIALSQVAMAHCVKDVMSKEIFCATPDTTIFEASQFMAEKRIRKLPIVEKGMLKGIVTQTDIVSAMDRFATHSIIDTMNTVRMWEIMAKQLIVCKTTDQIYKAKELMAKHNIGCLIATKDGKPEGIITEKDFVSEMAKNVSRLKHFKVVDMMRSPVVSMPPNLQLFEANHLLIEKGFRRLGVVSAEKLIGIVTQTDIAHSIYVFLDTVLKRIEQGKIKELSVENI